MPREKKNGDKDITKMIAKNIISALNQIDESFKKVTTMYIIAFYLGIFLVIFSVAIFFVNKEMNSLIFGGIGILDIFAFVIFKPAEDLQISRGNLAQLQSAFICWINDIDMWSQYIKKTSNNEDIGITFDELDRISKNMVSNTITLINSIEFSLTGRVPKEKKLIKQIDNTLNKTEEKSVPTEKE